MAQRLSTKKRPDREVKVTKPERKIETGVFDRHTLLILSKFIKRRVFESLDYPVSTGKEADVFHATTVDGRNLAVKIFRIETSNFRHMDQYLRSDPRFKGITDNKFDVVNAWTRKEFKNLLIMEMAGVKCPHPIISADNVLVMEFLGDQGMAYSTLFQTGSEAPVEDCKAIFDDIKRMYQAGFVHADLSEYNIMMTDKGPYIIDAGQGVVTKHPKALEFLRRDIDNIVRYFRKYDLGLDTETEYQKVTLAGVHPEKIRRKKKKFQREVDIDDTESTGDIEGAGKSAGADGSSDEEESDV